ncbi:MAG: adenosylcobinamide-phosphate synthase CbiB [Pseudomonadota bacterium]
MNAATLLFAWAVEISFGWPEWLHRRVRHPVVWIGWLVNRLDAAFNRASQSDRWRRIAGCLATTVVVLTTWIVTGLLVAALPESLLGLGLQALITSSLLASRSLYVHVKAVAIALSGQSIARAREAVAHIVGRDPEQLDRAGVARAALESLAENASDGVIAPLFWGVLLGLPGIAAYKAVNTLDSMIGHRNARFEHFGKFAARLDDLANWIPARITSLLLVLVSPQPGLARMVVQNDARKHRSPNAGWPEAAMAAALGVRLSGPRRYGNAVVEEPWLNAVGSDPDSPAVHRGLVLYIRALCLAAAVLVLIAVGTVMP